MQQLDLRSTRRMQSCSGAGVAGLRTSSGGKASAHMAGL